MYPLHVRSLCVFTIAALPLVYPANVGAVTTANNPDLYVSRPGSIHDGVAALVLSLSGGGGDNCSGALLSSGRHVLTAAHCLTDAAGLLDVDAMSIYLEGSRGTWTSEPQGYSIHPSWSGYIGDGYDIAIIRMAERAPTSIPRYDIYRESNELGRVATIAGYGLGGTGATGEDPDRYPFGTRRTGLNYYDDYFSSLGITPPGTVLGYDFDDGTTEHDAFGYFGINANTGLGADEALIARGDSGGPSFLNGRIAGIHSFGGWGGSPPDIDGVYLNASFGEFGGDTRVSMHARFIDSVLIPEPATGVLGFLGLAAALLLKRLRSSK